MTHLQQLFERLSLHGLIVNSAKCQFGLSTIDFLGYRVSSQGAVPLPARVDAVASFPRPRTVKALQEFLGMVNFYNRFIPHAAHVMQPLYGSLRGKDPKKETVWFPEMDRKESGRNWPIVGISQLTQESIPGTRR